MIYSWNPKAIHTVNNSYYIHNVSIELIRHLQFNSINILFLRKLYYLVYNLDFELAGWVGIIHASPTQFLQEA